MSLRKLLDDLDPRGSMDSTPGPTDLVNRCDEARTYEARLEAGP
jgi:hypothetical protein